jgi:putative membrane protein
MIKVKPKNRTGKNMKTNLKQLLALPLAVLMTQFATAVYAADANDNPGQLTASDYKFAKEAARGGMFEVNLGNVAQSNSKNTAVQQFGQQMVTDHGKAGQELEAIASRKGATLPAELTSHQQKEIDKLSKLTGPEFDKEYVSLMVKAHKMDERAFKKASEDVQDGDLKAFAANTLTVVQNHLKMAEDLEQTTKNEVSVR